MKKISVLVFAVFFVFCASGCGILGTDFVENLEQNLSALETEIEEKYSDTEELTEDIELLLEKLKALKSLNQTIQDAFDVARYEYENINYMVAPFSRGLTVSGTSMYSLPYTDSECLLSDMSCVIVDVLAAATVDHDNEEEWLYVKYNVWSDEDSGVGWIPTDMVAQYTVENQTLATAPVYLSNGAVIYFSSEESEASGYEEIYESDGGAFYIDTDAVLDIDAPNLSGDPVCINADAGWSAWVGSDDIIYPDILD